MKKQELWDIVNTKAKQIFVLVNTTENGVSHSVKINKKTANNLINAHWEKDDIKAKYYSAHKILYIG